MDFLPNESEDAIRSYLLANENVNRDGIDKNNNDLVVKEWDQVHKMKTNWVGVFKGDHYPGNKGQGIAVL